MERTARVGSKSGLHARPAAVFVQSVKEFPGKVTLAKNEKTVNAKSILSVISLGAAQGDEVVLTVNGDNAETVIDNLVALLESDLG